MNYIVRILLVLFFTGCTVNVFSQNIMISDQHAPNEPTICMDPDRPELLIAASNLNNYFVSADTGRTWTINRLESSFGVWGDPVLDVDNKGNFYFLHLSNPANGNWIDRIVIQKSVDHGATWSDGSFTGLNGTKAQDKQWSIINRDNNAMYVTWTEFDSYGSEDLSLRSNILFSKSLDVAETWSTPIIINEVDGDCIDSDNTVEGAVPALGPNGEIFVSWAGPLGLTFDRSMDDGITWLDHDIHIDSMPGGWDYLIPGIDRCNGLPVTKCDLSMSDYRGTIYVNWVDQRNGIDNTDVWLSKSTDNGSTWSTPVMVNDDGGDNHQFLTWMDIDQTNGYLYFVFYDRRNYEDSNTDVFMAISKDGGESFENIKISDSPFVPQNGVFFGDYNNIVAHNGIVRPIWTRMDNGSLSIWTDITPVDNWTATKELEAKKINLVTFPNPSTDISYVSFKLHESALIDLGLFDVNGKLVHILINKKKLGYGKYIESIDLDKVVLVSGTYYYMLSVDGVSSTLSLLVVE